MEQKILPAVSVVIFDDEGRVLLQKRKDTKSWCIISGHVEFGETIEAAALREIFEETRAQAQIVRFIGVYSSPESQIYHYEDAKVHYVTACFEARLLAPLDPNFNRKETMQLKFFYKDNLPENMALINPFWLSDALDRSRVFIR